MSNIVLFDWAHAATSFIPTENVDVRVFENNSRHRTPLLIQISNLFPSVHIDAISFATFQYSIDRPSAYSINIISVIGKCVSISALLELVFFWTFAGLSIIHIYSTTYVGKAWVQPASDQNIIINEPNCNWIWLQNQVLRHFFPTPQILFKFILQYKVLIVGITKEQTFGYGFNFIVEIGQKRIGIWKLNSRVLERPNLLKHLICNLRIQNHRAVLELVERWIKCFVQICEFVAEPVQFRFTLLFAILKTIDFTLDFWKVCFSALNVFLCFQQEDTLLFVMLIYCFCEDVSSIFEHFNHKFEFLVQLGDRVFLFLLQLLLDFLDVFFEDFGFADRCFHFFH